MVRQAILDLSCKNLNLKCSTFMFNKQQHHAHVRNLGPSIFCKASSALLHTIMALIILAEQPDKSLLIFQHLHPSSLHMGFSAVPLKKTLFRLPSILNHVFCMRGGSVDTWQYLYTMLGS
jgi:hypothetical protein